MRVFLTSLLAAGLIVTSAKAETFNNDSIIALSNAGVGDSVLLAKIDTLPCSYDVSTEQIIRLKSSGVSNAVITAMVGRCTGASRAQGTDDGAADPLVKRTPGIYIQLSEAGVLRLRAVRPTNVGGARVEGNGSILFPYTAKVSVAQPSAQTVAQTGQPVFYFYFESADGKTGDFGTSVSSAAQSPSEFNLVRFKQRGGLRELVIGKAGPFNATVGVDPKNTIPFAVREMGDGIFKVEMSSQLQAGQYAFLLRAGSDAYRIYDFEVK